jgi:predicted Zn-dependent protease
MRLPRNLAMAFGALLCALAFASCSVIQQGTDLLGSGKTAQTAKTAIQAGQKLRSGFADITEEEEYYIGRSVAALILARYPVYKNDGLTQYVNTVGNAVALYSDRPEIYAGYHFLILDTEEVNALATPGGMVFITKGLLRRCTDEETLALILAHEIGHVCAKHGLQSIKQSRLVDAFTFLGTQAAQRYGSEEVAKLTGIFENVLNDVVEKLIVSGYDRKFEFEADGLAVRFGTSTGYEAGGIVRFLKTMVADSSAASGKGWFKTHPAPEQRIEQVGQRIASLGSAPKIESVRTQRFKQSLATLK